MERVIQDGTTNQEHGAGIAAGGNDTTVASNPRQAAPRTHDLRMHAYYFGFTPTGVELVDRVLSAVAHAGKGYHHTEDWLSNDIDDWDCFRGGSYAGWIQCAASDAAASQRELLSALKAMVAGYDGVRQMLTSTTVIQKLEAAEAAIAKAEGK